MPGGEGQGCWRDSRVSTSERLAVISWLSRLFGQKNQGGREDLEPEELGRLGSDSSPYAVSSAAVLLPKQPFADWLAKTAGETMSLQDLRELPDRTVYLLEPWEGSWDSPQVLEAHAEEIFERELEEWVTDPSFGRGTETWPRSSSGSSSNSAHRWWILRVDPWYR